MSGSCELVVTELTGDAVLNYCRERKWKCIESQIRGSQKEILSLQEEMLNCLMAVTPRHGLHQEGNEYKYLGCAGVARIQVVNGEVELVRVQGVTNCENRNEVDRGDKKLKGTKVPGKIVKKNAKKKAKLKRSKLKKTMQNAAFS